MVLHTKHRSRRTSQLRFRRPLVVNPEKKLFRQLVVARTSIAAADEASGGKSSGWRATRKSSELSLSQSNLTKPSISMADSVRER